VDRVRQIIVRRKPASTPRAKGRALGAAPPPSPACLHPAAQRVQAHHGEKFDDTTYTIREGVELWQLRTVTASLPVGWTRAAY
jgi:hypothetical protein